MKYIQPKMKKIRGLNIISTHLQTQTISKLFFLDILSKFPSQIAFVLGHNSVVFYDWLKRKVLFESQCEEKCILYCAHFIQQARYASRLHVIIG